MDMNTYLEQELIHFGLMDKANEIFCNLGSHAAASYIKASYHLLSRVYHPDVNPENPGRATQEMKRLNNISQIIKKMTDNEIIEFLKERAVKPLDDRLKILLVEDDAILLDLFQRVLEVEGYSVQTAADGEEGLKLFNRFSADLILSDVVMPSMNGIEMVRRIRLIKPNIKVVFTSGYIDMNRIGSMVRSESDQHDYRILTKPFKISELLETIKIYLESKTGFQFIRGIGSNPSG